jgi:hypothetical protein
MSLFTTWNQKCRALLYEKDLLGWIEPMDEDGVMAIDGDQPGADAGSEALRDWHRSYVKVQYALESPLEEIRGAILDHPTYLALAHRASCFERYRVISQLLKQVSTSFATERHRADPFSYLHLSLGHLRACRLLSRLP